MDYKLSGLGERQFEHLVQSLALKVISQSVKIFGEGPDGGREATFDGKTKYPDPRTGLAWAGYGVIQAKFKRQVGDTDRDARWLKREIDKEMNKWAPKDGVSASGRTRMPRYIIFATDVELSAYPETGGTDSVDAQLANWCRDLNIVGWDVWDYNRLRAYLDSNKSVRETYAGLITTGDILAKLMDLFGPAVADIERRLIRYGRRELKSQQWVRLSQAGSQTAEKLRIGDIALDLPVVLGDADREGRVHRPVLDYLAAAGNGILSSHGDRAASRFVLLGGPGQGKSTATQILLQAYRAAFLRERLESANEPELALADEILARFEGIVTTPIHQRRWPMLIPLSAFGEAVSGREDTSLLKFMADDISAKSDTWLAAHAMRDWLANWPSLIVLDGLDEVANRQVRALVEERIEAFLDEVLENDFDCLIVATTRPQGYNNELRSHGFESLALRDLTASEAASYADSLIRVRHKEDPDLAVRVERGIIDAADDPTTVRLMRSPLQVTIMVLLLERFAKVPDSRYALFENYYQTIYEREVGKSGATATLLDQHRKDINSIHEQVAFEISLKSGMGGAEHLLRSDRLGDIAYRRLTSEGFEDSEARSLAEKIVKAATDRLVLIVPIEQDHVGFDIRSLQEYMTARAITNLEDSDLLLKTLRSLVGSAYWQNTWLLAVGRIFRSREQLRSGVVAILREVDAENVLAGLTLPGATLAAEMLSDYTAARQPNFERMLAQHAVEGIRRPPGDNIEVLASILQTAMNSTSGMREIIVDRVEHGLHGSGFEALSSLLVLACWADSARLPSSRARQLIRRVAQEWSGELLDGAVSVSRTYAHRSTRVFESRGRLQTDPRQGYLDLAALLGVGESQEADVPETRQIALDIVKRWQETGEVVASAVESAMSRHQAGPEQRMAILWEIVAAARRLRPVYWNLCSEVLEFVDTIVGWTEPQLPSGAVTRILNRD
jgi:hypothetical protein